MNESDAYLKMTQKKTTTLGSEVKTMLFIYRNALGMLSGLKNELDELVNNIDNLDVETIVNFYEPILKKANNLVNKIEDLEDEVKNHSDMKEYLSSIRIQLKGHNIDIWVKKFHPVKSQTIRAISNEYYQANKERLDKEYDERQKKQLEWMKEQREKSLELMKQVESHDIW